MAQAAIHPSERVDDVSQSVSGVEYLEEEKEKEKGEEERERERENFLNKMSRRRRERRRSSRTPSTSSVSLPSSIPFLMRPRRRASEERQRVTHSRVTRIQLPQSRRRDGVHRSACCLREREGGSEGEPM